MANPSYVRLSDDNMRGRIANLRSAVKPLLAGNYLPSFTDHSVEHSDMVCELVDQLTEPLGSGQLDDKEAFILYAAAYLHDVGLQHQRANETQVVGDILVSEYSNLAWSDLDIETRRSIVRQQHHRISGELITQSINAPSPTSLGIQLTDDWYPGQIRAIAIAHNLDMDSHDQLEYCELTKDWGGFRMSLLSALLRLADILDESRRRSQLHLERTRDLSLDSRMHWWRHYYVAEVEIQPRDRTITLWFDFPPVRRTQYREMLQPLQVPWVRAEFERHAEVFAGHGLLWHFRVSETPERHSVSVSMDNELERYILELLASRREHQAEQDRLLVVEQLKVARPTIEHELKDLRTEDSTANPEYKLRAFRDLARHLFQLGGRRDAWNMLQVEYDRLAPVVEIPMRFDVAMELATMMFEDGVHDRATRLLHNLTEQAESLAMPERYRFAALVARGYVETCAYTQATAALQRAADIAPDTKARNEQLAMLAETRMLQGDFDNTEDATVEEKSS
ncbi:MAG: HD domain-containing protein [Phycisphaerales bacterium]|nr:HD domain-containing protein [Phycisphaerales bacterium]